jgi:hypothetical protein
VVAVADGAGSAVRAAEGARHAVDAAFEFAAEMAWFGGVSCADSAVGAIAAARARLEGVAGCRSHLHQLAATLTVAVVGADEGGEVGVAQIGDGAVVFRRGDALTLAVTPERSEYLYETRFVTSPTWPADQQTFAGDAAGIDGVAVLTDGLQLLAFDMATAAPHAPFFDPLFGFAASERSTDAELHGFLASDRVNARTDDDKTIVVAVRHR